MRTKSNLMLLMLLAQLAMGSAAPTNGELQINLLQFLHRGAADTLACDEFKKAIEVILSGSGVKCEVMKRIVVRSELLDRDHGSIQSPVDVGEDEALNVWGFVEGFGGAEYVSHSLGWNYDQDFIRTHLICSMTKGGNKYASFQQAVIQKRKIISWNGIHCSSDLCSLAVPVRDFVLAVRNGSAGLSATEKRFHIPEESRVVKLVYEGKENGVALLPIPVAWSYQLLRFAEAGQIVADNEFEQKGESGNWRLPIAGGAVGLGALVGLTELSRESGNVFLLNDNPSSFRGEGSRFRLETGAGRLQVLMLLANLVGFGGLSADWPQAGAGYTQAEIDVPSRLMVGSIAERSYFFEKKELDSQPFYQLRFPINEMFTTRLSVHTLKQSYRQHCEINSQGFVSNDTASFSVGLYSLKSTLHYSLPVLTPAFKFNAGLGFESVHAKLWNDHPLFVSPDPNDSRILETSISDIRFSTLLNLGCELTIANVVSICADFSWRFPETYKFENGFWIRREVRHISVTALLNIGKLAWK